MQNFFYTEILYIYVVQLIVIFFIFSAQGIVDVLPCSSKSRRSAQNARPKKQILAGEMPLSDVEMDTTVEYKSDRNESELKTPAKDILTPMSAAVQPPIELDKVGLASFTECYGLDLDVEKARHEVVKDIFKTGRLDEDVLRRHPTETVKSAMSKFMSWFMVSFTNEFS